MTILISDKTDLKSKSVQETKKLFIEASIHQENITITNIYIPNDIIKIDKVEMEK